MSLKQIAQPKKTTDAGEPRTTRRPRGQARLELLEAAREVFNERGYAEASTREIAERANVSETLMFRYFGSKAGLFKAALVQPFLDFVDDFTEKHSQATYDDDDESAARQFIAGLYDLFHKNRGLVAMFFAAEAMLSSELAESGVLDEVAARLQLLADTGRKLTRERHGVELARPWLTANSTLSMVAGMATFGPSFYGRQRPSRAAIIEEITQAVVYGHRHRLK